MKLKFLISIIIFTFSGMLLYSQCISVELTVKWNKEANVFRNDSIDCIPKLCITYRNNSNLDYYFHKFSNSEDEYPEFISGMMFHYPYEDYINPDYLKRAKNHYVHSGENFRVVIGAYPSFNEAWIVEKDSSNQSLTGIRDIINQHLLDIYNYYYYKKKKVQNSTIPMKFGFSVSDLDPENLLKSSDEFVFLRKEEVHVDTFNLIGFEMVKGTFTFQVNPEYLKDYVTTESFKDGNFNSIESKLPSKAGDYQLYSGDFRSNQVSITFK